MIVGALTLDMFVPEARTLKDKRRAVSSVKSRIRDRFNVSVAEVGYNDLHQRCLIGVAAVSNETRELHSLFDKIVDVVRGKPDVSLVDYKREFF